MSFEKEIALARRAADMLEYNAGMGGYMMVPEGMYSPEYNRELHEKMRGAFVEIVVGPVLKKKGQG